jgi:hypothetical protein
VQRDFESLFARWPHRLQESADLRRFTNETCVQVDELLRLCPSIGLTLTDDVWTQSGVLARATVALDLCAGLLGNDTARLAALKYNGGNGWCRADAYNVLVAPLLRSSEKIRLFANVLVRKVVWSDDVDAELVMHTRVTSSSRRRAVGVLVRHAFGTQYDLQTGYVRAVRGVIVACGVLGTPAVLHRSGIGQLAALLQSGIRPAAVLPDVGRHVREHALGTIRCPVRKGVYAFSDRISDLLMVGVTSDDRVAINVAVIDKCEQPLLACRFVTSRGYLEVYFMVAKPVTEGSIDLHPAQWLGDRDALPSVTMPFLQEPRDADDFARGRKIAWAVIGQNFTQFVDLGR